MTVVRSLTLKLPKTATNLTTQPPPARSFTRSLHSLSALPSLRFLLPPRSLLRPTDRPAGSDEEVELDTSVHGEHNKLRSLARNVTFVLMSMLPERDVNAVVAKLEQQRLDNSSNGTSSRLSSVGTTRSFVRVKEVIDAVANIPGRADVSTALEVRNGVEGARKEELFHFRGKTFRDALSRLFDFFFILNLGFRHY